MLGKTICPFGQSGSKDKMNLKEFLELLTIFGLSAIKFGMAGVPAAVFAQLSVFKALTVTISGGFAGTLFFTFLSEWSLEKFRKIKEKYFPVTNKKSKKIFTKSNRLIVAFKVKFGLIGLAIITPLILSIPLGTFLAIKYYSNKQKIIVYMFTSISIWAIVLYFFLHYFHSKLL